MSDTSGKGERSFKANLEALFDELSLAYQWGRPSLLLAVNRSTIGQEKARQALQQKLEAAGRRVLSITIHEAQPDAAVTLLTEEKPSEPVFFVQGLERGGGVDGKDAYYALNLSRELFVENQLKVVFWLMPNEAAALTQFAPDFWAFRHRVIEFASPVPRLSGEILARLLLWPGAAMPDSSTGLEEKIRSLEDTLAALPQAAESLSLRIESYYLIGHAWWAAGDMEKAFKALTSGMGLARDQDFAHLNTWLLSGVGILRQEQGQSLEALDIFQDLVQYDPNNGLLLMNLAVGLCAVGKNSEGLRQGARAVLRDPRSAPLWNTLGHLQLSLGKSDEAVDCFEKAASLVSSAAIYRESIAAAYQRMGLTDEALAQVEAARNLQNAPYDRSGILIKAIRGNTAGAAEQLSAAVSAGLISKASLGHDANLNTILDPVQITEGL